MIAFGYLDGDFYESITESLRHCLPRMAPGGLLVIDDYADIEANPRAWNGLPGVKKACDDYFGPDSPIEPVISDSDLPMGIYRHPA
jgi:O-methyltransferase